MISTGKAGRPGLRLSLSAGEQVVRAELVEAAQAQAQFEGDGLGREKAGAGLSKEMADERSRETVGELLGELRFFMARKLAGRWIYRIETATGQG